MNITSYNITDVGYHYIGLRALAGLSTARREDQTSAISRSVLKYVRDKALRLMLPEPRGTFETVGEKVCQELVHFQFARSSRGAYELTETGLAVLRLVESRKHAELRRIIATVHLSTYDNLRVVVHRHLELGNIWRPVVDASQLGDAKYIDGLLAPTFKDEAAAQASLVLSSLEAKTPKKVEDALHEQVLRKTIPQTRFGVPLFRSLCDRLVSLRLLNVKKANIGTCDFAQSYTPCAAVPPPDRWHTKLDIPLHSGNSFAIYFSEPDMDAPDIQRKLMQTLDEAFSSLSERAGYYDLPEVRDYACERLKIPEASFDEGVNRILDLQPCPLTLGLQYEEISGRRKPLVRDRGTTQIYNLLRRA